jgi:hypothetical protein
MVTNVPSNVCYHGELGHTRKVIYKVRWRESKSRGEPIVRLHVRNVVFKDDFDITL